jgi:hypothetical protein
VPSRVTIYPSALADAYRLSTPERVRVAEEIAAEARGNAPVRTGEYRDGIGTQVSGDRVFVTDEDPEAGYKEYGTLDTPAHAVLTDAASKRGRYSGYQPR